MWDGNDQAFHVGPHILKVEIEYVYFLIGISKWGDQILLVGHKGTDLSTEEYMARYYRVRAQKISGKIPIKDVVICPLHMILFTITKLVGTTSPHLDSKAQMDYGIECLEPKVFNWCEGFLVNLKDKITKCKMERQK